MNFSDQLVVLIFFKRRVFCLFQDKSKQEIRDVLTKLVENVSDVSAPISERATEKNRGFCFLDFNTYFEAAAVRNVSFLS